ERALISARTRDALAAAKKRGVKLGGPKLTEARKVALENIKANADRSGANVLPVIKEIMRAGATSLRDVAEALNARGIPLPAPRPPNRLPSHPSLRPVRQRPSRRQARTLSTGSQCAIAANRARQQR